MRNYLDKRNFECKNIFWGTGRRFNHVDISSAVQLGLSASLQSLVYLWLEYLTFENSERSNNVPENSNTWQARCLYIYK